jgi:hypothetical protein
MLGVVDILAAILGAIRPAHCPITGNVTLLPLPNKLTAICKGASAIAFHPLVYELPLVSHTTVQFENPMTILGVVREFSFVQRSIWPCFLSLSTFFAFNPLSFVSPSIWPYQLSMTMCTSIDSLALIKTTICTFDPMMMWRQLLRAIRLG